MSLSNALYADLTKGLSANTIREIELKAESGRPLDIPTAEKEELYRRAQQTATQRIIEKAQSGQALDTPNDWKNSIYNQYAPKQTTTTTATPTSNVNPTSNVGTSYVNSTYDNQRESQLKALQASRDQAVGQLNQQKTENTEAYQAQRNQADVVNAQSVQRLREAMAARGLTASGENVTATVGLQSARQNALNSLNLSERQATNDINRQMSDLYNPANEQALIAAIEAQRSQALYGAYRDTIGDSQWQQQFDAANRQWQQQFDTSNSQWQQQFNQSNNQFNQSLAFQKEQFQSEQAWRQYAYNNLSASEKAQFELNREQFGEEMAWRLFELQSNNQTTISTNEALINFYRNGGK